MSGNKACVEGALKAGVNFFAGYPITPSTEIAEHLSVELPKNGGTFMQMEDEIASISSVAGAALTGACAMTATSGPGFSLMQEVLGFSAMAEIPLVIIDVMRVGPSTGLATVSSHGDVMQVRWGTHGDHPAICLCPTSVSEAYYMTIKCFELAQRYYTPVVLLSDALLGTMQETVSINESNGIAIPVVHKNHGKWWNTGLSEVSVQEKGPMHITGLVHTDGGFSTNSKSVAEKLITRINTKIDCSDPDLNVCEAKTNNTDDILVISYGVISRLAKTVVEHLKADGKQIGYAVPKVLWPVSQALTHIIQNSGAKKIVVAEMNLGQYAKAIREVSGDKEVISIGKCGGDRFEFNELYEKIGGCFREL